MESKTKTVLTKKDLNKVGLRSIFYLNSVFNFQKMQASGWTNSMAPALEKIYKDDKEGLVDSLVDNMEFINTNTNMSSFLMGLLLSLEERKEDRELIKGLKVGLFAPLAGIGDAIFWFTLLPIIAGLSASFAIKGNVLGPIIFFVAYLVITLSRLGLVRLGYKLGTNAIEKIKDLSSHVSKAAVTLGCTVIGGLMASYLSLPILLSINVAEGHAIFIQEDFLDKLFPGILPIALTFFLYYLLKKKNANPVILILLLLGLSIVGSFLGVF